MVVMARVVSHVLWWLLVDSCTWTLPNCELQTPDHCITSLTSHGCQPVRNGDDNELDFWSAGWWELWLKVAIDSRDRCGNAEHSNTTVTAVITTVTYYRQNHRTLVAFEKLIWACILITLCRQTLHYKKIFRVTWVKIAARTPWRKTTNNLQNNVRLWLPE